MAHDKLGRAVANHASLVDGRKTVTTATTAEALSLTSIIVDWIIIQAESDNTGTITVGASTVVGASGATRRGINLTAGETLVLEAVDLSTIYLDSTVNTDGVTFVYAT